MRACASAGISRYSTLRLGPFGRHSASSSFSVSFRAAGAIRKKFQPREIDVVRQYLKWARMNGHVEPGMSKLHDAY